MMKVNPKKIAFSRQLLDGGIAATFQGCLVCRLLAVVAVGFNLYFHTIFMAAMFLLGFFVDIFLHSFI